jgi:hypothetical protein
LQEPRSKSKAKVKGFEAADEGHVAVPDLVSCGPSLQSNRKLTLGPMLPF